MLARRIRLIIVALSCAAAGLAQGVRVGPRFGISATANPGGVVELDYESRRYGVSVADIPVGFHVGLALQARAKRVVFQPEVLFHSTRTDYRLDESFLGEVITTLRTERFSHVEVPAPVAFKWGPLRLQGGPVGRVLLARSSEFEGVADYVDRSPRYELGYQAGVGLDIRRFVLDVKYDGAFAPIGADVELAGQQLRFGTARGRTYATLGWLMFGGRRAG